MKAVLILVVISFAALINCQNTDTTSSKLPDPIVGTWKSIEITYDGEKYDEMGYSTFTPGGFWSFQLRTPNPLNLTRPPETLEEYKSVVGSYKAAFGSYKIDGDSCLCFGTYDLKPQFMGNVVRGKYQVVNDTLIFDVGKWRYTWIRQE
jgi:hypothetical protein